MIANRSTIQKNITILIKISIILFFSYTAPPAYGNEINITEGYDSAGTVPVKIFREYLSAIDGDRCPMYPSCSTYSLEAVKKHGLFKGWIMACDRLLRCGRDEISLSRTVRINGKWYCYDPVEENDFWWKMEMGEE